MYKKHQWRAGCKQVTAVLIAVVIVDVITFLFLTFITSFLLLLMNSPLLFFNYRSLTSSD